MRTTTRASAPNRHALQPSTLNQGTPLAPTAHERLASAGLALVTVEELAALLHLSPWTLYIWARSKPHRLPPAVRLGSRVLFRECDVRTFIENQGAAAPPPPILVATEKKGRGRPTKTEQVAKRAAKVGGAL
jgi:predicted DNA-binding transcriptional regulator AlpA